MEDRFFAVHNDPAHPRESVVWDYERDTVVAEFHDYGDGSHVRRAEFLVSALNAAPRIRVGDRIRFVSDYGAYPFGYIHAGDTGTLVAIVRDEEPVRVEVRMDHPRHIADFLEWDGAVWLMGGTGYESPEEIALGVIVPDDSSAPLYTLDGNPIDMVEFLRANTDAPDYDEMIADIQNLEPSQGCVIGGGALATFALVRIR